MQRREFIKIAGASAAGSVLLGGLSSNWFGTYDDPVPDPGTDGDRVVPTFCELCFWKCGVLAHVKQGRVTKITGNPKHPLSNGRLCPRGAGGTGLLYDPDRLKTPLVRVGSRGEQKFEAVSWDTALGEVAENFEKIRVTYGPEALALFYHGYGANWIKHLFKAYGSPNITAPSFAQCRGPRDVGFDLTFGSGVGSPENTDMENTRCLVLIGSHLGENMHNTQVQDFSEAIRRGVDLIVVDPRFSVAASKARHWLPVRPGSDMALLLAWAHVLVHEGGYAREYIEQHAYGFGPFSEHLKSFTPEWAWPRTGIDPGVIRETAALMAGASPRAIVHPGRHVTWYGDDTQRSRMIAILNALLGSWGHRGGFLNQSSIELAGFPVPAYGTHHREAVDRPVPSHYPLADQLLAQGVCNSTIPGYSEYDLKGWMVYGSNLPTTLPDPKKTYEAIQKLDFLVTVDVLPAEICGWSDVVLPECTYLERCDDLFNPPYKVPFVAVRQEVVPPMHESKPGWWIASELARKLNLQEFFPWKDSLEYATQRAHGAGLDCDALQRDGVITAPTPVPTCVEDGLQLEFYTDSGKIELFSNKLLAQGFDPMPVYTDHGDPPEGYFRLLFGRAPTHTFGRTTNNRLLSETFSENEVWLNSAAARRWNLSHGQRVRLQNQDGALSTFSAPLKVTDRIRPDAVFLVHGYGRKARGLNFVHGRGIDTAELVTSTKVDPIMGGTGMNVNFVTVIPASDEGGTHA
ncbi:MAG: molybdopterin-dependent oxidoreductase [Calditrichaeota bacterium]|nr:molybdopterin-dependent oxidoreductase [Calditrichota bacterium]